MDNAGHSAQHRLLLLTLALAVAWPALLLAAPLADNEGISRWNIDASSPPITYYVDPSMGSSASLVDTAFANWSASSIPSVYITFNKVSSSTGAQIVVTSPASLGIAGAGGVAHGTGDSQGHLVSCEADIGASALSSSDALQTITHEVGHCLGLQHSVVSGAIMSYRAGESQAPTDDDRYALTLLYPASGSGYPAGCATVERRSGDRPKPPAGPEAAGFAALSLLMLAGLSGLRPRRPRAGGR